MLSIIFLLTPNVVLSVRTDNSIEKAKHLIKKHEGFAARSYKDGNTRRIGYGVVAGRRTRITEEEADSLLEIKLIKCLAYVERRVQVELTESQLVALIDHVYNVGNMSKKLVKYVNNKDTVRASKLLSDYQYGRICRDGQVVRVRMGGLVVRSNQRALLYAGGYTVDLEEDSKYKVVVKEVEDGIREDANKPLWRVFFGGSIRDSGQGLCKGYSQSENGQGWQTDNERGLRVGYAHVPLQRLWDNRICPVPHIGYSGQLSVCERIRPLIRL